MYAFHFVCQIVALPYHVKLSTIVDRVDTPDSFSNQSNTELTPTSVSSSHRPFADSQQLALDHVRMADKIDREARSNKNSMFLPEMHKIMDSGIDLELGFESRARIGSTATPKPSPANSQMQARIDAASSGTLTRPEARPP